MPNLWKKHHWEQPLYSLDLIVTATYFSVVPLCDRLLSEANNLQHFSHSVSVFIFNKML